MTPRLRIAPTPSGYLHSGNLFNFLLTVTLCQKLGGSLSLRIDDLDAGRTRPAYINHIFDTLSALDIAWNEGPKTVADFTENYTQHKRLSLYQHYLNQLTISGLVYACTCTRSQLIAQAPTGVYTGTCKHKKLPLNTPGAAWRIHVPPNTTVRFTDQLLGPQAQNLSQSMGDFVIRRKEGLPAYQLASMVDDVFQGCTHIVRGVDLLASTAAQCYLAAHLNEPSILAVKYLHHPLLTTETGEKLSKSAGNAAPLPTSSALKTQVEQLMPLVNETILKLKLI